MVDMESSSQVTDHTEVYDALYKVFVVSEIADRAERRLATFDLFEELTAKLRAALSKS